MRPEPGTAVGELVPHVVRQGEYLSRLAHRLGFDAESVWDHPDNAELKQARAHADQLLAGDLLWLPRQAPEPRPRHACGPLPAGRNDGR